MFDVLKHVRLPLVATKLLEGYVNNCTDLSLKVQYSILQYSTVQYSTVQYSTATSHQTRPRHETYS